MMSRTDTSVQPRMEADFAFGHYGPARIWDRGTGNGYHDPSPQRKFGQSMEFKQWMDKWTTPGPPSFARRYPPLEDERSPLQRVPALNLNQTQRSASVGSRPPTGGSVYSEASAPDAVHVTHGQPRWELAHKTSTYPNATNWKHNTSLLTRNPGFVGTFRTR
eukprot:TRINITY_DN17918_c0_g1_i1.p1 TRINITY_DN17918_c0_g1~~TRINITY_DN17918_c0_g1_i1.p1  ORF type:complete len:162 (+),score=12.12 TRINITY_DN17918_c0_g1_i1:53-538(+)